MSTEDVLGPDELPHVIASRIEAIRRERLGDNLLDVSFRYVCWPNDRPDLTEPISLTGSTPRPLPSLCVVLTWRVADKDSLWNGELEYIEEAMGDPYQVDLMINGMGSFETDPDDGNARLFEYQSHVEESSGHIVTGEFWFSLYNRLDGEMAHTAPFHRTVGPQYRVTDIWNHRGVRCCLVERWWPLPVDWFENMSEDTTWATLDYWTGYIYVGDVGTLPAFPATYNGEFDVPQITYRDANGWLGWDAMADDTITRERAKTLTNVLAILIRQHWEELDVTPTEVYADG